MGPAPCPRDRVVAVFRAEGVYTELIRAGLSTVARDHQFRCRSLEAGTRTFSVEYWAQTVIAGVDG